MDTVLEIGVKSSLIDQGGVGSCDDSEKCIIYGQFYVVKQEKIDDDLCIKSYSHGCIRVGDGPLEKRLISDVLEVPPEIFVLIVPCQTQIEIGDRLRSVEGHKASVASRISN